MMECTWCSKPNSTVRNLSKKYQTQLQQFSVILSWETSWLWNQRSSENVTASHFSDKRSLVRRLSLHGLYADLSILGQCCWKQRKSSTFEPEDFPNSALNTSPHKTSWMWWWHASQRKSFPSFCWSKAHAPFLRPVFAAVVSNDIATTLSLISDSSCYFFTSSFIKFQNCYELLHFMTSDYNCHSTFFSRPPSNCRKQLSNKVNLFNVHYTAGCWTLRTWYHRLQSCE